MSHSNTSINRQLIDTANLFRYALAASYYAVAGDAGVKRKDAVVIVVRKDLSGQFRLQRKACAEESAKH